MSTVTDTSKPLLSPAEQLELEAICRRHGIRWLAVFGSCVRGEMRPDSDVDVLVEWDESVRMTYLKLEDLAMELSTIFGGRYVDIGRPRQLHWYLRDQILAEARVLYAR